MKTKQTLFLLNQKAINFNWDVESNLNLLNECLLEIQKCKSQSIGMTFLVSFYINVYKRT